MRYGITVRYFVGSTEYGKSRWIYTVSAFRTFSSVFLRFCFFLKKYALFHPHFYKSISALSRLLYIDKNFVQKFCVWRIRAIFQNRAVPLYKKIFSENFSSVCDCLVSAIVIVIVITFYSPSCLGQETAKWPFGLRVKLPPAHLSTTHGGGFTLSLLIAERQAGKLWIPIFIVFGLTRPGIEPESTASVADALSTRPLIG